MIIHLRCVTLGCAVLLLASAPVTATANQKNYVLLISIDGFPARQFSDTKLKIPTLRRLARAGRTAAAKTIFPSMTWPAHASLITGTWPRRHGVVGNRFYDRAKRRLRSSWQVPRRELIRTPTLFDAATNAGIKSASILWPCTRDDPSISWNIPEVYGQRNFASWSSPGFLDALQKEGIPSDKLGVFGAREMFLLDAFARDSAVHVLTTHKPQLLAVHFVGADTVGHLFGSPSAPVSWTLEIIDGFVANLIAAYKQAGILGRTTVFIVSDHGFLEVTHKFDADKLLHQQGLIPTLGRLSKAPVITVSNGQALHVYLLDKSKRADHEQIVRRAFKPYQQKFIERIYSPRQFRQLGLPLPGRDGRVGDLIVLARPNVVFRRIRGGKRIVARSGLRSMHGYLPSHKDNLALFIASGFGVIAKAKPGRIDNVDVAPTIARLLGLKLPTADGRPIALR